jgi:hypothetical protein
MRIGISLNDVMRSYSAQLSYVFKKYHLYGSSDEEKDLVDVKKTPIEDFDKMYEYFNFESKGEFYSFVFDEAPLEILGHADEMENNLMSMFNSFLMDIDDEEEHEVELVSRDVYKGISATYFFLTKTACNCGRVRLVKQYEDVWDGVDLLITANPEEVKSKPEGKVVVKVTNSYNKDVTADFEVKSVAQFFMDEKLRGEILEHNNKLTNK